MKERKESKSERGSEFVVGGFSVFETDKRVKWRENRNGVKREERKERIFWVWFNGKERAKVEGIERKEKEKS